MALLLILKPNVLSGLFYDINITVAFVSRSEEDLFRD